MMTMIMLKKSMMMYEAYYRVVVMRVAMMVIIEVMMVMIVGTIGERDGGNCVDNNSLGDGGKPIGQRDSFS